ncbi:RagB/SusD family nutrient uptake outer membrane protein [Saccharicrinis sp. FJH2]|uniref:RagB/SusD family nutrient uptake outer membrane protein n=1 Tax=Saccharicrinis sp. FJH65 TaxID=3344659 RepID=UPI0035F3FE36
MKQKIVMKNPDLKHSSAYLTLVSEYKVVSGLMKKRIINILGAAGIMLMVLGTWSCSDVLEVNPSDVLTPDQNYRDIFDANSAVIGVYGKLQELAPQYVVLNELRADLMAVTVNADHYMREVANHNVTADNPWVDPQPFFSLILNCNDVMKNLKIMVDEHKISKEEFNPRYSDIAAVRSWTYLQLAIHYGHVPYITEPIDQLSDVSKIDQGEYPFLSLEVMVDTLVNFMESVPYKGLYTDQNLLLSNNGFSPQISYIDKEFLLGELHLWNNDYLQAAEYYKRIMERSVGNFDRYKVGTDFFTFSHYHCGYIRYYEHDLNSVVNHWGTLFSTYGSGDYYDEWIWVMYYSSTYTPSPFIDLFSNTYGNYYFKPSNLIVSDWKGQIQQNGFPGDFRGDIEDEDGNSGSYKTINGQPVITKYISDFDPGNPYDKNGKWFLWRSAGLHLRFCEATNRYAQEMGADNLTVDSLEADNWQTNEALALYKVSYALLNNSFRPNFETDDPANDFTQRHQTHLPFPFDFDARSTSINDNPPAVRALWYRNEGIRNRAYLDNVPYYPENIDSVGLINYLEDRIIEEDALELAFEGQRWGDLVRIALRRDDPSYLADKVADKLAAEGNADAEAVRVKLSNEENWWLPLTNNK